MNILYLINHAGNGGSEKYVQVLCEAVESKGDKAYLAYGEHGALADKRMDTSYELPMRHPFDVTAVWGLAKLCRELEIDVVHTQFPRENYIALLCKLFSRRKLQVVYTAHMHLHAGRIHKLLNWTLTGANAQVIAVCNSVREMLITQRYPDNRIQVIYNGVPHEPLPTAPQEVKFTFVTLARLSPEKGLSFLLKAARKLKNRGIDFQLKIAGEGGLRHQLEREIIQQNLTEHVFLLGHVLDTRTLLATSHVYVNSSEHEALSFGVLEGMVAGLPVIATHVGGNVDIIRKAENGLLVAYDDADALAEAMADMITQAETYERYVTNSHQATATTFNVTQILEQTYQVYVDVTTPTQA